MTNVSEMTNEDLLRVYWKNCRKSPHAFDDTLDNDLYEELLRRLSAAGSGEPPQSCCPKCGSNDLALAKMRFVQVRCNSCATTWFRMESVADFAQFFGPSAPSPQANKGWVSEPDWPEQSRNASYRAGLRDAQQAFRDWYRRVGTFEASRRPSAPSGSAGQEPRCGVPIGFSENIMVHCDKPKGHDGGYHEPEGRAESEPCLWPKSGSCSCNPKNPNHTFITGAAAQPVVANPPRFGKWIEFLRKCSAEAHLANTTITFAHDVFDGLLAELAGLAKQPKVEEIAHLIGYEWNNGASTTVEEAALTVLRPFFTQVSQPPTDDVRLKWDGSADVLYLCFGDTPPKQIFDDSSGDVIRYNKETGAPCGATVISFCERSAEEEIKLSWPGAAPVTPVSGNGTEPPNRYWDIFTADDGSRLLRLCWRKNDAGNFMAMEVAEFCTWNNAAEQKEAEEFALKALNQVEAGAASHNGQGWESRETELLIKLRAADEMARIADDWVERGQIDSRSALADARLNYGKPYTYEFSQPLPAPPSEANGPQQQDNK